MLGPYGDNFSFVDLPNQSEGIDAHHIMSSSARTRMMVRAQDVLRLQVLLNYRNNRTPLPPTHACTPDAQNAFLVSMCKLPKCGDPPDPSVHFRGIRRSFLERSRCETYGKRVRAGINQQRPAKCCGSHLEDLTFLLCLLNMLPLHHRDLLPCAGPHILSLLTIAML